MLILIHGINIGITSASPKDSGIKGATDGLAIAFQEELMEEQGHAQKRRYCYTERDFPHLFILIIII
jgi:hypothetical protein